MKQAKRPALAGMLAALAVVIMFLMSLIDTLDLTAAMFGGLIVTVALVEMGSGYALAVYAASSVLAFVLLPNKFAAIEFACFAGFYPVVKKYIERIRLFALRWLVKLALFAVVLVPVIQFGLLGFETVWYLYPFAAAAMILYDVTVRFFAIFYIRNIQPKLRR